MLFVFRTQARMHAYMRVLTAVPRCVAAPDVTRDLFESCILKRAERNNTNYPSHAWTRWKAAAATRCQLRLAVLCLLVGGRSSVCGVSFFYTSVPCFSRAWGPLAPALPIAQTTVSSRANVCLPGCPTSGASAALTHRPSFFTRRSVPFTWGSADCRGYNPGGKPEAQQPFQLKDPGCTFCCRGVQLIH